jgi:hypothetical protein
MFLKPVFCFVLFAILISHGSADLDFGCLQNALSSLGFAGPEQFGNEREKVVNAFYKKAQPLEDAKYKTYCKTFLDERFIFSKKFLSASEKCWSPAAFAGIQNDVIAAEEGYPIYCDMKGSLRQGISLSFRDS